MLKAKQQANMKNERSYIAIKIVDYRVRALAGDSAATAEWEDLSDATLISTDREAIFQLARKHGGLLCSADGVPGVRQAKAFHDSRTAIERVSDDEEGASGIEGEARLGPPKRNRQDDSRGNEPAPGMDFGLPHTPALSPGHMAGLGAH